MDPIALAGLIFTALGVPAALIAWRTHYRQAAGGQFESAFAYLQSHQAELRDIALRESPPEWRSDEFSLLVRPGWILGEPLPIEQVKLMWAAPKEPVRLVGLPVLGSTNFSDHLLRRPEMANLFNGVVYRPVTIDITAGVFTMGFAKGRYFDHIDKSEVLALEAASRTLASRSVSSGRYRRSVGDPFDFVTRATSLGINTLTVRRESAAKQGFFLHLRGARNMVNETRLIHVVPAGEFTPSDVSLEAIGRDFDLTRNIMREYAEEFLSVDDAQGKGGRTIDFASEFPFSEMDAARRAGDMRIFVLGLCLDPLVWKLELMTVCVMEAVAFDSIFADMVRENDEGTIVSGVRNEGIPFTERNVYRYVDDPSTTKGAAACLKLAWRARQHLGLAE